MASKLSALDIENDLKRLLNICVTKDEQNSNSFGEEHKGVCNVVTSDSSSVALDRVEKRLELNGSRNVNHVESSGESGPMETDPNTKKAKKKKRNQIKKKVKSLKKIEKIKKESESEELVSDRIAAAVEKPTRVPPPTPVLPSVVKVESDVRPHVEVRPKVVANGPMERQNVDSEHLRAGDVEIHPNSIKEPNLSKFNLSQFDLCPNVPLPEEILNILKKEWIVPLKKKSSRHPRAHYVCHLCIYHCDDLTVCSKHIKGPKHVTMKEEHEINSILEHIPVPSEAQSEVQSDLLIAIAAHNGLQEIDIFRRIDTFKEIEEILRATLQSGCELQLFGSSASMLGLKGCDLNINLEVAEKTNLIAAVVLQNVHDVILSRKDVFQNVDMDTLTNLPMITFIHRRTSMKCVIGLNNGACVKTTNLLAQYAQFDEKVRVLCVAFRYWAMLCRLNDQRRGTLPPHTFDLMVVYFLQQCDPPILPVFHEQFKSSESFDIAKLKVTWKSENRNSIGRLWIEMLRFYSLPFPRKDLVVCVRQKALTTALKNNWRGRKLPVEDPYITKRNLTRSVTSPKVSEFILMCLKLSFRYFGIPQLKSGPLFNKITKPFDDNRDVNTNHIDPSVKTEDDEDRTDVEQHRRTRQESYATDASQLSEEEDLLLVESSKDDEDDADDVNTLRGEGQDGEEPRRKTEHEPQIEKDIPRLPLPDDMFEKFYTVKKDEMSYSFSWKILTGGKFPILECSLCKRQGHLKDGCPDEILPRINPLPPMQKPFMEMLNRACIWIWKNFSPCREELQDREDILNDMQVFVRNIYPDARLELFGSSCNGFGFRQSDLDICLTFKNNETGEKLQFAEITLNLAENLKKYKAVYHVIAIPTAKVPIVKFMHRNRPLECDISLYNTLAQHNTRMLYIYSEIDPRVKALGFTMKYFAKICDIGDASRGSLSSYAYVLMVIYYLQQRKPAVIPVLQQLYDRSKPQPEEVVDGWNAWFFKDIQNLKNVWPAFGQNKETVGELWLGLLRFYTEEFNFKTNVVSIRQIEPLSRFEKLWNKKTIAIEDPFNLSHNLGSGVSRKMNTYIMKAFIMGRWMFGTPVNFPPKPYRCVEDYLFDPRQLTDGPPPNDRCCRACGHIGHIVRDCPRKKFAKEQQVSDKKEKVTKRTNSSERVKNAEKSSTPSDPARNKIGPSENVRVKSDMNKLHGNKVPTVRIASKALPQPLVPHMVVNSDAQKANYAALGLASRLASESVKCEPRNAEIKHRSMGAIERPMPRAPPQSVSRPPPGFTNVPDIDQQRLLQSIRMERENLARQMTADRMLPQQHRENVPLPHNNTISNERTFMAPPGLVRYISPFSTVEENVGSADLAKSKQSAAMLRFAALQQMGAAGLPVFANAQSMTQHFIPPFIPNTQRFAAANMGPFGTVVEPVQSTGFNCNQDLNS